jgi:hypothetical protein
MMKNKNHKFIINTITNWDEPPRARHQVTLEISKHFEVIFINANHFGFPKIRIEIINENLTILYPYFPVSYKIRYRVPIINEIFQIWLFTKIKRKYIGYEIISFDFSSTLLSKFFRDTIYFCNDNYSAISSRINNCLVYKYHSWCEVKVAKNATFCIVTSEILKKKLLKLNPRVYTLPLGGPDITQYDLKPSFKQIDLENSSINVGLVGFIREYNTSSQVLNSLLEIENITITLIGTVENKFFNSLNNKNKIRALGVLTGKDLYEEVSKFDIAIAPYPFHKFDDGGTPNKLLLYLSLGMPVVVTKLAAIECHLYPKNTVYFANDLDEFVKLVLHAIKNNSPNLLKERLSFATKNTWEIRINKLIDILEAII